MTTEAHVYQSLQAATVAATGSSGARRLPVCGCGQDLDLCTRAHCPRCGATLVVTAA